MTMEWKQQKESLGITMFTLALGASVTLLAGCYDDGRDEAPVSAQATRVEQIVDEYLASIDRSAQPDSPAYAIFMKDVIFGLQPDLTEGEHGDDVVAFAADHLRGAGLLSLAAAPVSQPDFGAAPPEQEVGAAPLANFNRSAVVNYAYSWALNGQKRRNSAYPDFNDDCTNFVSQAIRAGGASLSGGGLCNYESTTSEWYVQLAPLLGCPSLWAWSTTWSVAEDFRWFHGPVGNATVTYYTNNTLSQLRAAAQPGDIVQLLLNAAAFHSMVVTRKANGEIYLTYHSGPNNLDVVDRALANIANSSYGYVLVRF